MGSKRCSRHDGAGIRERGSGIRATAASSGVGPPGKRGESIRGELLDEFHQLESCRDKPSAVSKARRWYWGQTLRRALRYTISPSPQQPLSYPRSRTMFELTSDIKAAVRGFS